MRSQRRQIPAHHVIDETVNILLFADLVFIDSLSLVPPGSFYDITPHFANKSF